MKDSPELNHPWMIAIWPGMGNVAINAGYYLLAKLRMHLESELTARELFEIGHVHVEKGMIRAGRLPRSRFFRWKNPGEGRDLIVFLGEAQPPTGVYAFCRRIVDHARELGVERVFTFAAMATPMALEHDSRVFIAATDPEAIEEGRRLKLEILDEAQISGLNGVLPEVAGEGGIEGICLLGEMPHVFTQVAYPKASLEVLRVFSKMAGIGIDLSDLERDSEAMNEQLKTLMSRIEEAIRAQQGGEAAVPAPGPDREKPPGLDPADRKRIEELFEQAAEDRSKAYQLKQELDRLKVFAKFEDRFLDLFKSTKGPEEPET